jgi:hypothetical protein
MRSRGIYKEISLGVCFLFQVTDRSMRLTLIGSYIVMYMGHMGLDIWQYSNTPPQSEHPSQRSSQTELKRKTYTTLYITP